MCTSYCEFEKAAISAVQRVVCNELKAYSNWRGMNLHPALERALICYVVNNRAYLEPFIYCESHVLWSALQDFHKNNTGFLSSLVHSKSGILKFYENAKAAAKALKYPRKLSQHSKKKFLVVTHHSKFVPYLLKTGLSGQEVAWILLADRKRISKVLDTNECVFELGTAFNEERVTQIISNLLDLALKLNEALTKIRPEYVVYTEGDASYHSLLAEVARSNGIKSVCLQWGIFYEGWRDIAFSNMRPDYFLTWGKYFSEDLRFANPDTNLIEYGHPLALFDSSKVIKRKKIHFLAQAPVEAITGSDFDQFVKLCAEVKHMLPDWEVVYRPHPSVPMPNIETSLESLGVVIDNGANIIDSLVDSAISVAITSSSLMDALLVDSIPVSFAPCCLKHSIPFSSLGIGFNVERKDDALKLVLDLAASPAKRKSLMRKIRDAKNSFFSIPTEPLPDFVRTLQ